MRDVAALVTLGEGVGISKLGTARSRLYRSRWLQITTKILVRNTRSAVSEPMLCEQITRGSAKLFDEIYKIYADLQTFVFAPLRPQNYSRNASNVFCDGIAKMNLFFGTP